jgi:hypothetical protein
MHSHSSTADARGMAATASTKAAATASTKAAATASTSRERRRRKSERRTKRARNETTEKLTTHRIPPCSRIVATAAVATSEHGGLATCSTISND